MGGCGVGMALPPAKTFENNPSKSPKTPDLYPAVPVYQVISKAPASKAHKSSVHAQTYKLH